ncbi:hypothetical protein [Candidatus Nitrotoga sp. BS]|nr:hypothetical protein [Candidatus Nitrotoga sp. BS]
MPVSSFHLSPLQEGGVNDTLHELHVKEKWEDKTLMVCDYYHN